MAIKSSCPWARTGKGIYPLHRNRLLLRVKEYFFFLFFFHAVAIKVFSSKSMYNANRVNWRCGIDIRKNKKGRQKETEGRRRGEGGY